MLALGGVLSNKSISGNRGKTVGEGGGEGQSIVGPLSQNIVIVVSLIAEDWHHKQLNDSVINPRCQV